MTETVEATLKEPTPQRLKALADVFGVSVEDLQRGDVPDSPTPTEVEHALVVMCEDHRQFAPYKWSVARRNAILGGLMAQFVVESALRY